MQNKRIILGCEYYGILSQSLKFMSLAKMVKIEGLIVKEPPEGADPMNICYNVVN